MFDATYAEVLAFADASWLVRFPRAVEGLEHRLSTYANALQLAVERASADTDDSDDVDPRASLWGLLSFLRSSHDTGQVTDADYEWYRSRARLALSELEHKPVGSPAAVSALLGPQPSPSPLADLPVDAPSAGASPVSASPAPSQVAAAPTPASFSELVASQSQRPKPRIVLASEAMAPPSCS